MLMLPLRALAGPPLIGASSMARPRFASRSAADATNAGDSVLLSTATAPGASPAATPSAPNTTSSVCSSSTTTVNTTSATLASDAGESCTVAPAERASSSASGRMSRTWTT